MLNIEILIFGICMMGSAIIGMVIGGLLFTAGDSDKDAEIIELKNENIELKRQLNIINKINDERTITVEEIKYECTNNLFDACQETCCYLCPYDSECKYVCLQNTVSCGKSKRGD